MYQSCETAYNTPFIGLFMVAPEYIKLLENIEDVIYRPLVFITRADSKYKDYLKEDWIIGVFEGTDSRSFSCTIIRKRRYCRNGAED